MTDTAKNVQNYNDLNAEDAKVIAKQKRDIDELNAMVTAYRHRFEQMYELAGDLLHRPENANILLRNGMSAKQYYQNIRVALREDLQNIADRT